MQGALGQMSIGNNGPAQDWANQDLVVTKFGHSPPGFAELDEMLIGNR